MNSNSHLNVHSNSHSNSESQGPQSTNYLKCIDNDLCNLFNAIDQIVRYDNNNNEYYRLNKIAAILGIKNAIEIKISKINYEHYKNINFCNKSKSEIKHAKPTTRFCSKNGVLEILGNSRKSAALKYIKFRDNIVMGNIRDYGTYKINVNEWTKSKYSKTKLRGIHASNEKIKKSLQKSSKSSKEQKPNAKDIEIVKKSLDTYIRQKNNCQLTSNTKTTIYWDSLKDLIIIISGIKKYKFKAIFWKNVVKITLQDYKNITIKWKHDNK